MIILIVFGVNLFLIWPYLFQTSPGWVESIEVGFITTARWWAQNFPHVWWNPYWYAGFPMRFSYVPFIPLTTAALGTIIGNFTQAYHLIVGFSYALVPASLFFLMRFVTKNTWAAFFGTLAFSLMSPLANLFNYSREAQGLFPDLHLPPWRLMTVVIWGEGPHSLAQIFLPLAGLFYLKTNEENKYSNIIITAVFTSLVALSNPIGLWALALLFGSTFTVYLFWRTDKKRVLINTFWVAIFAYLFSSFWYTPGFIRGDLFGEGGGVFKKIFEYFPWGITGVLLVFGFYLFILRKLIKSERQAAIILWYTITFLIVWIFYKFKIEFSPQARRYITEVDMGQATILAMIVAGISAFFKEKLPGLKLSKAIGTIIPVFFIVILLVFTQKTWTAARSFVNSNDEAKTNFAERKMNSYLSGVVKPMERIFASANYSFWLNYQTNLWQLRGGHWQASINFWQPHAEYQITNGEDGETSLLWLKSFGISWLVVNLPESIVHYNDYRYPAKFGLLLGEGTFVDKPSEVVYQIPLKTGLIGAVNLNQMPKIKPPINGADKEALAKYVTWIEESDSKLYLKVVNNDSYLISGETQNEEGIRIAVSFDRGFKARSAQGEKLLIEKDPLGFVVIKPKVSGNQEITLSYGPTFDFYFGWILFIGGVMLAFYLGHFYATNVKT